MSAKIYQVVLTQFDSADGFTRFETWHEREPWIVRNFIFVLAAIAVAATIVPALIL